MTFYSPDDGTDPRGIVGKVTPGIFAQEGRCYAFVYENVSGQAGHCRQPVTWRGRWNFRTGGRRCGVARGTPMSCPGRGGCAAPERPKFTQGKSPSPPLAPPVSRVAAGGAVVPGAAAARRFWPAGRFRLLSPHHTEWALRSEVP